MRVGITGLGPEDSAKVVLSIRKPTRDTADCPAMNQYGAVFRIDRMCPLELDRGAILVSILKK